jgi:hypothetical protein
MLVQGERHESSFNFLQAYRYSVFPATFGEKVVFSPYVFGTFVESQLGIAVWIHIWVFYTRLTIEFLNLLKPP